MTDSSNAPQTPQTGEPPTHEPWTPDMPLRADATDEQIEHRFRYVARHTRDAMKWVFHIGRFVAREYAAACVAAANPRLPAFDADGEPIQRPLAASPPEERGERGGAAELREAATETVEQLRKAADRIDSVVRYLAAVTHYAVTPGDLSDSLRSSATRLSAAIDAARSPEKS